ncbi:MAG: hypothetical protein KJ970_13745 [Candidatus Eisenbacteria bacterium]|uniref:CUB domain-containing protein n=1 Tax=Eiseniibacteriota bacterium TaxID=2212470 RepID=A0A948RYK9_UNCEI|nr:hypothetical protein [Candidatus Eisenbacteria bacterium]MBU1949795.1 hypothetical protein [Candidatus Eisenbacteria bacterium]MBU2691978.1 hypothetical protein [Candidatus Eisenbacteria bacterium]
MPRRLLFLFVLLVAIDIAAAEDIEIGYDEGIAGAFAFQTLGSANAVRFTPLTYPMKILSTKMFLEVYEASCDSQSVWILDDDGEEGQPGTTLYGPTPLMVPAATGRMWIEFSLPDTSNIVISAGDFYVAYVQHGVPFECTSLGLDTNTDEPARQWQYVDGEWGISYPISDFMIRAIVRTGIVPTKMISWGAIKSRY